ncbi:MAG: DUF3467 domain-containing protein [Terracidiphilus sp.]|jgi:hypothetical protein
MGHTTRKKQFEEEPEARYANHFHVGHNAFEVIVEFGQQYTEGSCQDENALHPRMHTRVAMAPVYAKELQELLESALDDYERKFAPIVPRGKHE